MLLRPGSNYCRSEFPLIDRHVASFDKNTVQTYAARERSVRPGSSIHSLNRHRSPCEE